MQLSSLIQLDLAFLAQEIVPITPFTAGLAFMAQEIQINRSLGSVIHLQFMPLIFDTTVLP